MASICLHAFNYYTVRQGLQKSLKLLLLVAIVTCFSVRSASASFVNLHLDVDYTGADANNGGTWSLSAITGGQGLFALGIGITGINTGVNFHVPEGMVNGTDVAGFATQLNTTISGGRQIFVGQQALPGTVSEQGAFYGVGTLNNGAPNSPASPGGTNNVGPVLSSLSGLTNAPWATGHLSSAFEVASGTFSAGSSPAFDMGSPLNQALIFNSVAPSSSDLGNFVEAPITSTSLTTNLGITVAQGDFNGDDIVDAADYTLWRDTLGQFVFPGSGADAVPDGLIDQSDYAIWVANFGTSFPSVSSASASAVPEPSAATFAVLGMLIGALPNRKRICA